MLDSARLGCSRLLLPGFKLAIAFFVLEGSIAGCRADAEPVGTSSSSLSLGDIGGAIVPNGVFTNVYVYPNPATTTWEQHVAARGASAAQFSRASIDAATDRMMAEVWPSYFSPLFQYACGVDDPSCGINPPQFFGSGVASQACVDAALQMAQNNNGVLGLDTIRYLANCHAAGMAPSPQLNLIFSPDIPVAKLSYPDTSGPEMCATSKERGWHSWNVNIPNFSVVPTSTTCFKTFANFTQILSHEIVEVLTDPGGLGFGDFPTYTQEAADLCQNIDPLTIVRGDTLARYWSNTDNNCQPRLDPLPGTKATTEVLTPPTGILMGDVYNPNAKAYPASNPTASLPALAMAPTSAAPANLVVQQVLVVIQTGIGTESSSFLTVTDVDVSLEWKGGNPVPTNILAEAPFLFLAGQTHSAQLNLPGPAIHAGDITGITITLHLPPHPAPARTWEIEKVALVISTVAGFTTLPVQPTIRTRMDRSALPLVRFSGLVHDWQGYTDFLPAEARQVPVQELDLIISTGGDELRGGPSPGDNCDVTLVYDNQSPVTLPNRLLKNHRLGIDMEIAV